MVMILGTPRSFFGNSINYSELTTIRRITQKYFIALDEIHISPIPSMLTFIIKESNDMVLSIDPPIIAAIGFYAHLH